MEECGLLKINFKIKVKRMREVVARGRVMDESLVEREGFRTIIEARSRTKLGKIQVALFLLHLVLPTQIMVTATKL